VFLFEKKNNIPIIIILFLREEAGAKPSTGSRTSSGKFTREIDDMLRPGLENKYVYQNIESEYYRRAMQRLAYVLVWFIT